MFPHLVGAVVVGDANGDDVEREPPTAKLYLNLAFGFIPLGFNLHGNADIVLFALKQRLISVTPEVSRRLSS
jgi:hypothetical protein